MISNYYTLHSVTRSLRALLAESRISQIYTQAGDELVMAFEGGESSLVFSADRELPTFYINSRTARARSNTADLLKDAWGRSFRDIRISPSDRIATLELMSGDAIVFQVAGARSNAFLLNEQNVVLDAFKRPRQSIGRTINIPVHEVVYDFSCLQDDCRARPTENAARLIKDRFPMLGPVVVRELFSRSGLVPDHPAGQLSSADLAHIETAGRAILLELAHPRPRIYYDESGTPRHFAIIECTHLDSFTQGNFQDIHEAIRTFLFRSRSAAQTSSALGSLRASLRRTLEKLMRARTAMLDEAHEAERSTEYERNGTAILSMLPALRKGASEFQAPHGKVQLDPALSPVQNAERYFNRARRARTAALEKEARLQDVNARLHAAHTLLAALDEIGSDGELDSFRRTHAQELDRFGLSQRAQKQQELPFRVFRVDGGFTVWVGKSSANNDLLTMKYAKPRDLWFHARGASGSHVVLKIATGKGEPGKRAIEEAASIAAYYSKMKSSSLVPVAVTERRFVRKPRGSSPGSVLIERERVVFVRPHLPNRDRENPIPD